MTISTLQGAIILAVADAVKELAPLPFNTDTTLRIKAYRRAIAGPLADIEERKMELLREYGETKDGVRFSMGPQSPRYAEFLPRWTEVMVREFDLTGSLVPLSVEDFWRHLEKNEEREEGETTRRRVGVSADVLEQLGPLLIENAT